MRIFWVFVPFKKWDTFDLELSIKYINICGFSIIEDKYKKYVIYNPKKLIRWKATRITNHFFIANNP